MYPVPAIPTRVMFYSTGINWRLIGGVVTVWQYGKVVAYWYDPKTIRRYFPYIKD